MANHVADSGAAEHAALLEHDTHVAAQPCLLTFRVEAQHRNRTGGRGAVALADLEGAGFSSAIRAENSGHLTGPRDEGNAVDSGEISITDDEILNDNCL